VAVTLRTRLVAQMSLMTQMSKAKRGLAIGVAFLMAGGLATGIAQAAGAEPKPTISQVQAEINALTAKFDKAVQQYDQVAQQLTAARARLSQVNKQMASDQARYTAAREKAVQIVNAAYMNSGRTSLAGMLTSNDPAAVLTDASMIMQLTHSRNLETQAYFAAAQQLTSVQQEQKRTEMGIAQLVAQRAKTKNSIGKLLDSEKATLDTLTAQQQAAVQAATVGGGGTGTTGGGTTGGGSTPPPVNNVPTNSQAGQAVAFVYGQLGCPYVYGGTGPCGSGYDCSGLVQAAWASAGVSIPRDTYEQWAALPHIAMSSLQPGDLLYYNGIGHVAMYVGNGYIIDAPVPGQSVEKVPMNTSWYASTLDGAARP
jgi:peptidoglycan DL-endopeptidase CwlO